MPRNGSGTFTVDVDFTTEAASPPIEISKLDQALEDIGDEISNSMAADGQTPATGNLNLNGNKLVNVGNATADADALNRVTADARYLQTVSNDDWSGADLAVTNGGTGASDASTARTNLGLAIGSNVQAYDAKLAAIAGLAVTDGNVIVGNGTTWVAESGSTARTSLGIGTIATRALTISTSDPSSGADGDVWFKYST